MIQRFLTPFLGQLTFKCRIDNQKLELLTEHVMGQRKDEWANHIFKTRKTQF